MKKILWLIIVMVSMLLQSIVVAEASDVYVDMQRIRTIESSGNPRAYNVSSQARGLYQITPIVVKEWNNYHPRDKHTVEQLFSSSINSKIAHWYMNHRIPQMLRYYGVEDTVDNRLVCYNAGVSYVVGNGKVLPSETVGYIRKYHNQ